MLLYNSIGPNPRVARMTIVAWHARMKARPSAAA